MYQLGRSALALCILLGVGLSQSQQDRFSNFLELLKLQVQIEKTGDFLRRDCPNLFQQPGVSRYLRSEPRVGESPSYNDVTSEELALKISLANHTLEFLIQSYLRCTADQQNNINGTGCRQSGTPTIGNTSMVFQYSPANTRHSAWMRDSQPTDNSSANRVWFFRGFVRNNAVVMFDSVEAMKRNHSRETIRLPYNWAGTGHVVYRDSVYFQRAHTKTIIKYDFKNRTAMIEASMRDIDGGNKCTYPWGGYTTTDFAVDEYGLWLVYGNISNNCNLVIAKINPDTLDVEKSWETTIRSGSVGNTFMKCGVLYATNSYGEISNYIRYTYDTDTGKQESLPPNGIPFKQPGKYKTMFDYNPHDGLLYYADLIKGYLATFPIV